MRKTNSNAVWNGLSAEQRGILERWLFEENLGYEKALERARAEFGYAGSRTGLQRFYQRTAELRMMRETASDADGADEEEARRSAMRALAKLFLKQVTENPDDFKEWAVLGKLVLNSEANGLRRTLDGEKNDIWRTGVALAREKFEFDAAEAALEQLENRDDLDAEELAREKARVLAIRTRLYGRELTKEEIARGEPNA